MDTSILISKILTANKIEDVLSVDDFKLQFNTILKEIHPDICKLSGAVDATAKMNQWKDVFENGKTYKDDLGTFKTNGYWVDFFKSSEKNVAWSFENYNLLSALVDKPSEHFKKYIPQKSEILPDGTVRFIFEKRAIPLSGLVLPQEHVNWVLNRLLEYCAYLSEIGFVHCGLNPESVFIVPETHGIQICSFYHFTKVGNRIGTISGKYQNWYPQEVFQTKIATPLIDNECSKRIAAYLLGDISGSGVRFRKTHNEDFVNFIISQQQQTAYQSLSFYRELLAKNFKKEFHLLTI